MRNHFRKILFTLIENYPKSDKNRRHTLDFEQADEQNLVIVPYFGSYFQLITLEENISIQQPPYPFQCLLYLFSSEVLKSGKNNC